MGKFLDPDLATAFNILEKVVPEELVYRPALSRVTDEALANKVFHFWGP